MDLNLDTPLPMDNHMDTVPPPQIAVLVTTLHQVSACQLPLPQGFHSQWQGHTLMTLPVVASCQGCLQAACPSTQEADPFLSTHPESIQQFPLSTLQCQMAKLLPSTRQQPLQLLSLLSCPSTWPEAWGKGLTPLASITDNRPQ